MERVQMGLVFTEKNAEVLMVAEDIQENYGQGWIKLYRSLMNKAWYKKPNYVHLWIHLMMKATHTGKQYWVNGKAINLNPGQFVTGRKELSIETGIHESSIERILTYFDKIEHQIEQQKNSTSRLISIVNYYQYQKPEQQIEQPLNNQRTTAEQRLNTKQEGEERKEGKEIVYMPPPKKPVKKKTFVPPTVDEVREYFKVNGYSDVSAVKAFEYYNVADWKDRDGKQVLNWKQKMQGVWFKPENKQQPKSKFTFPV